MLLGTLGRGFWGGYGWNINKYIHLGYFSALGGAGASTKECATRSRSQAFPNKEAVPVGLGLGWLLVLGAFGRGFEWGNLYSSSIILLKSYSTIYLTIERRERMDAGTQLWMTFIWMSHSINRTRHQSQQLRIVFVIGDIGRFFS